MPNRLFLRGAATALMLSFMLAACVAAPAPAPAAVQATMPALTTTLAAAPKTAPAAAPRQEPVDAVLAYADRVRLLAPSDLAHEIDRLSHDGSPVASMQLALALGRSHVPANVTRAQTLMLEIVARPDAEAAALRPLARLLAEQLAEQRRADELAERNGQQLREAQRRIDQLNDRLDALRAIERSLPTRPRNEATAPRPSKPRSAAQ